MENFEELKIVKHTVFSSGQIEDILSNGIIRIINVAQRKIITKNQEGGLVEIDLNSDDEIIVQSEKEFAAKFRKKMKKNEKNPTKESYINKSYKL